MALTGVGVVCHEAGVVRRGAAHLLGDGLARHAHVALLGLLAGVQRQRRAGARAAVAAATTRQAY